MTEPMRGAERAQMMQGADRAPVLGDADFPGYNMGTAAQAIGVSPAFLRAVESAGLFRSHRSGGGHRRYSRDDLERADRARHLVDDGTRLDAAVRIVDLEYQLAAANAMIEILRRRLGDPPTGG